MWKWLPWNSREVFLWKCFIIWWKRKRQKPSWNCRITKSEAVIIQLLFIFDPSLNGVSLAFYAFRAHFIVFHAFLAHFILTHFIILLVNTEMIWATFDVPEINYCGSNPCNNGGSCQNNADDYECMCPQGYTGSNCEVEEDECVSSPCAQGATCVDKVIMLAETGVSVDTWRVVPWGRFIR